MEFIQEGYVRVSDIVSMYTNFDHIDKRILERKRIIGTDVHRAIEEHYKGGYYPLDEACDGYFGSFLKWDMEEPREVKKTETRFYGKSMPVTGCVDLIDNNGIVDFKTSAVANPKAWMLQGMFYHFLAKESGYPVGDMITFVKLDKKGLLPDSFLFVADENGYELCRSAYLMWKHFRG